MNFILLGLFILGFQSHAALAPEPIDTEIEKIKPRPNDTPADAARKCAKLAIDSRTRGISTLLIGIEGQGGFAADNAWLVYRYLWRITHGEQDQPPVLDTRAPVLNRLLLPLIDHYQAKIEVLDFPETEVRANFGGQPQACAEEWLARVPGAQLILLGHSFGGDAIHDLATRMQPLTITQAYSIDAIARSPAKRFRKPNNVELWTNFYQLNEPPFGEFMRMAESNRNLSSHGVNHRTIVRSPPVIEQIKLNLKVQ